MGMNPAMKTVPFLGPNLKDKAALLTLARVMRRGWSRTMVKTLLGLPDFQTKNLKGASNVLLYLVSRVEQAERTPEFLNVVHGVALRENEQRARPHASTCHRR